VTLPTLQKRRASTQIPAHSPTLCLAPVPQPTRRAYREILYTAPIGPAGVSGAIMFAEALGQAAADGTPFVQCLVQQGVMPDIKVDEVRLAQIRSAQ